ncbi:MAG: metal-sensing transcriptional repressor [bacterium]|nr:metal-sensing transcriptional repressor [bacterium]
MEDNKNTITALKKAHSHLGRVIKMAEEKEYCINILQQNLAVIGLLKSANSKILEGHLNSCFQNAMRGTNEKRKKEMIEEILVINKLSK